MGVRRGVIPSFIFGEKPIKNPNRNKGRNYIIDYKAFNSAEKKRYSGPRY